MKGVCRSAVLSLLLVLCAWAGELDLPQKDKPLETQAGIVPLQAEAEAERPEVNSQPFTAGRWLFLTYGSAAVGKSARRVYAGHSGVGYDIIDGFAVNLEAVGHAIDQEDDTVGVSLDLVPRWHYLRQGNWSLYLDGGLGLIYSDNKDL